MIPLFLFFFLVSGPSFSAHEEETLFITNVKVEGRTFSHSCQYYSNTETELKVTFSPGPIDYGTRIFIEFGWEGVDSTPSGLFNWAEKTEKEMEVLENGFWFANVNQIIAERSSPVRIKAMNFVFRIQEPGKKPKYVGGVLENDTFVTRVIPTEESGCVNPGSTLPDFQELVVQIERP